MTAEALDYVELGAVYTAERMRTNSLEKALKAVIERALNPFDGRIDELVMSAAQFYFTTPEAIRSDSREREPSLARREVWFLAIHLHGLSQSNVGRKFNRDPSTINKQLIRFETEIEELPGLKARIQGILGLKKAANDV